MRFLRFGKSSHGVVPKSNLRKERAAVKQSDEVIGHGSELVTTPRGYAIANYTIKKGDRRSITEVKPMPNFDQVIMKSRRASSIARLSDGKDYMESDIDDFDRKPSARRRRDMASTFPGIESLDAELSDEDFEDDDGEDLSHEMLVSGRPSRIRFPGAAGDSRLEPVSYVHDEDDDEGDGISGQRAIRARYGGDRISRRAQRRGPREDYLEDEDVVGKSLGFRNRPVKLSFELIKSRLQDAMADGNLDPNLLLCFASSEPRCGVDLGAQMRAIATIPVAVRRRYGLPTDLGPWEVQGAIRRELAA